MRVILWMLTWFVVGSVAFVAGYLFLPALGPVSPEALNYSLTAETGGSGLFGVDGCRRTRRGWRCEVPDSGNSGTWSYALERRGRRCWRARLVQDGGEGVPPRRASGCVGVRHQLRIVDRLLSE